MDRWPAGAFTQRLPKTHQDPLSFALGKPPRTPQDGCCSILWFPPVTLPLVNGCVRDASDHPLQTRPLEWAHLSPIFQRCMVGAAPQNWCKLWHSPSHRRMRHTFSILNPCNGPHLNGEAPEAGGPENLPKVIHILPGERQYKPVPPVKTGIRPCCCPSLACARNPHGQRMVQETSEQQMSVCLQLCFCPFCTPGPHGVLFLACPSRWLLDLAPSLCFFLSLSLQPSSLSQPWPFTYISHLYKHLPTV